MVMYVQYLATETSMHPRSGRTSLYCVSSLFRYCTYSTYQVFSHSGVPTLLRIVCNNYWGPYRITARSPEETANATVNCPKTKLPKC
jgi:hypothetical protein